MKNDSMNQMNQMNHLQGIRCIENIFGFQGIANAKIIVFGSGVWQFLGSFRFIGEVFAYFSLITINKLLVISSLDVSNVRG